MCIISLKTITKHLTRQARNIKSSHGADSHAIYGTFIVQLFPLTASNHVQIEVAKLKQLKQLSEMLLEIIVKSTFTLTRRRVESFALPTSLLAALPQASGDFKFSCALHFNVLGSLFALFRFFRRSLRACSCLSSWVRVVCLLLRTICDLHAKKFIDYRLQCQRILSKRRSQRRRRRRSKLDRSLLQLQLSWHHQQ